jgi:1-acyl-sn-glycerol-3-phosphate acyltransferase
MKKVDLPIIHDCIPTARGNFSSRFGLFMLTLLGWKVSGELPNTPKFVAAVAPHTSNWDFVVAVSTMLAMNLRVKFMGKKDIFIWPFKSVLQSWGGIPIDRHAKNGVVEQMVEQFKSNEQLILGIAPEGTRSKTKKWKSGFLHIALQSGVPVVPVSLDFAEKELKFHPAIELSNDIDAELECIKNKFASVCAKNPQAV